MQQVLDFINIYKLKISESQMLIIESIYKNNNNVKFDWETERLINTFNFTIELSYFDMASKYLNTFKITNKC